MPFKDLNFSEARVDGRYNSGSKHLLNYLLFGFCELLTSEISGGKITDEELEDFVVLVKAASVHVYCNPLNYPYLLRYIAHWRNLQLHCLNKEEYDDNERAEEFKITSFISMVQGCEHIGIQYGEPSLGEKQPQFDPFILEKWPLIQAYAFEDFGRSTADCQPFVLLGSHSSRQNITTSDRESSLNNNTTVGNSGINGNSAQHLVCFAVDPKGILKCARTYFLQNGFVPISLTDIGETSSLRHSKDLRLLIDLYLLAIDAVMKGVETFSKTSDWQKSFSAVLSELKSGLEKKKIELMKSSFLSHNVEFSVDACDSLGRVVNLRNDKPHLAIKRGGGKEKGMSKQIEAFAKSKCDSEVLGKQLIYCGQVFVASPVNRWEADLALFYFQPPNYQGSSFKIWRMALLVLTYHPSIMDNLPPHLLTEHSYLVLAFTSGSHVYRQLYADVIHLWKDNQLSSFPPFETVTDLPEYLHESLSCLEKEHLHVSSANEEFLPSLKSFLRHMSVSSSFGEKPLQAEDLQILLGDNPYGPRKQLQEFELLLTVLTGAPQSGKDSLCQALMALAKENSNFARFSCHNAVEPATPSHQWEKAASSYFDSRDGSTMLSSRDVLNHRTPDVELILSDSAFEECSMVQKRLLMCPGWSLGLFPSGAAEPPVSEGQFIVSRGVFASLAPIKEKLKTRKDLSKDELTKISFSRYAALLLGLAYGYRRNEYLKPIAAREKEAEAAQAKERAELEAIRKAEAAKIPLF
ncbi:Dynein axonemal assembly factor 9 [Acropora cervicornis]|uniref:Dynein axonemal assembly factor 9 n=1 Tax=Acropora cervicornis TaxID=6130 RepID=A0AAD9QBZ0_ACRCE|nr:Dynein axonemal assembly factor 9 [Acropora cervicornis]